MSENKEIELHQDEVKEIMEKPPHWLIGYGISLISGILLLLLVGSYFFKYPDIVKSRVELQQMGKTIEGKIAISPSQLAKVSVGQSVNLKLDCYPFLEYGILRSEVREIICYENETDGHWHYEAIIMLDMPLISSQGKKFHFWPGMTGEAEIITDDQRLITQLLKIF